MKRATAVLVVVAALLAAPAALACPRTTLGDVEDEVMCPVCETPLSTATEAPQAQRQRELIQRLIDDCRSKDQIKEALVAEFGDEVLASPSAEGFDLAAYVVPGLAIILGAGGVAYAAVLWRRRRRPDTPSQAPAPAADSRLEADLERYDL